MATPIYEGREKTFYKLLDRIAMCGAESVVLSPKKYLSHHASSEDLLMMLDLMKPKYYFPIKGEYSELVSNGDLAYKIGIPRENIILKENGYVACFCDGELVHDYKNIKTGVISIDGESSKDVGELVLKDVGTNDYQKLFNDTKVKIENLLRNDWEEEKDINNKI